MQLRKFITCLKLFGIPWCLSCFGLCSLSVNTVSKFVTFALDMELCFHNWLCWYHILGVSCDSCLKGNFTGKRYKCLICYDYDLCSACYETGVASTTRHSAEHPMQCILTRSDFGTLILVLCFGYVEHKIEVELPLHKIQKSSHLSIFFVWILKSFLNLWKNCLLLIQNHAILSSAWFCVGKV